MIVTAQDEEWLAAATAALTGYGTSVIGCDAELAVERRLSGNETPDGRPGVAIMAFAFSVAKVARAIANRVGQAVLTCPTAALFDGLPEAAERAPLGDYLHYFGDGHERTSGQAWVLPVMEGDIAIPATCGVASGVAGGNLIFMGSAPAPVLAAARSAALALADLAGVITPFPGGVCRSGSKVGSRYSALVASTNEAYCPTLRDRVATRLPEGATVAYEVIINAAEETLLRQAMQIAIRTGQGPAVLGITASSYGGKLGKIVIPLVELADGEKR
ncbi:Formyltransferase/hydrolase complex subunit D [Botrimarina hoheduenensis]|uniref:Formyltransferase/hydrolase complex subunit D n=1 Tax=Botrimarina hoheduenensis TaxID=2528000 RepID=A0A5C5WCF5_9BACT|nr:Formyltransferase/hydrolase complex subunit D [Botrimarina hoheduenensis]